jgi:hypothetical protein
MRDDGLEEASVSRLAPKAALPATRRARCPDAEATTKLVPAAARSRRSLVATTIQVSASSTARWITAAGPGAPHTAMTMYPEMGMTYWLEKAEAEVTELQR